MYPRHLKMRVERALRTTRVVHLVGPRQAGKTTLVRELVPAAAFLTLDDFDVRRSLERDAYSLLKSMRTELGDSGPLVIDEVQRLPELALVIKRLVDEDPRAGQFIITGSSDILSTGTAADSLAGRALTLTLYPTSAGEISRRPEPLPLLEMLGSTDSEPLDIASPPEYSRDDIIQRVLRGGFPAIRDLDSPDREDALHSYLDSVIERDAAELFDVRKPDALRRLTNQLAVRTSEELNLTELANALTISRPTVESYLGLLEQLFVVTRVGAWTSSQAKREIKASKVHFVDTGCAAALRNEDESSWKLTARPTNFGPMLETWVFNELKRTLPFCRRRWRLYHWRYKEREIDIVAEAPDGHLVLMEVKAASSVPSNAFDHLDAFVERGPGQNRVCTRVVFYLGERVLPMGKGRVAVPVGCFL
jgi:hypothetical protein